MRRTTRTITSLTATALMTAAFGTSAATAANMGTRATDGGTSTSMDCRAVAVRVQATDRHSTEHGVANRAGVGCTAEEDAIARTPGLRASGLRAMTEMAPCVCDPESRAAAQLSRLEYRTHRLDIAVSKIGAWTSTTAYGGEVEHFGESTVGRLVVNGVRVGGRDMTESRTLRPAPGVVIKLNRSYESSRGIRQVALEVLVDRRSVLVVGEARTGASKG